MNQRATVHHLRIGLRSMLAAIVLTAFPANADLLSTFGQLLDAPNQTPHPAIVRVYAKDSRSLATGSGTLVHHDDQHGYVLTNWHVVRDVENGQVMVVFPDGYESAATIVKTDDRWDLALLKTWRHNVSPMPLSSTVPVVGEPLTIVGYGSGKYRAANGTCKYYAAPDNQSPQEMIEVSVAARQGDSGGPIVNARGELAAVLFGSGRGVTTGTHIGRVVTFLNSISAESLASGDKVAVDKVADDKRSDHTGVNDTFVADRVIQRVKAQQAAFVTPRDVAVNANNNLSPDPSQYYQLPPLEWSTVDDNTHVATATTQPDNLMSVSVPSNTSNLAQMPNIPPNTHLQIPMSVERIAQPNVATERIASLGTGSNLRQSQTRPFPTNTPQNYASLDSRTSGNARSTLRHDTFVRNDEEVIQIPPMNVGKLLRVLQAGLAIFGLVTLLEKIRK